jgi:hypothetical protein
MKFIFITLAAFFALVLSSPVPEAISDSDPNYFLNQPFEDGKQFKRPEVLPFPGGHIPICVCFVSPCFCHPRGK